ncbi:MAG: putative porin [Acidobacteria bacterium]|nr:putative porin [Acidobacteriota bacterium]
MRHLKLLLILVLGLAAAPLAAQETGAAPGMEERIRQLEAQIKAQQEALEALKQEMEAGREEMVTKTELAEKDTENKKMAMDVVDKALSKEMKKTNLAGVKFGGDVRLRYEGTSFDDTTIDRNRFRFRLRVNVQKTIGYGLTGYFQFASGNTTLSSGADLGGEATSTNQTMGASWERKGAWIDQAYLTWTPDLPGHFFTFGGGKFKNVFVQTAGTPLVYDTDVNPEGFYQTFTKTFGGVTPFFTMGQLFIKENAAGPDAYMLAYQGGVTVPVGPATATVSSNYYHYIRYATNFKYANGNTVIRPAGFNNDVLAAGKFDSLGVMAKVNAKPRGIPVEANFEYYKNLNDMNHTGVNADQDTAWQVGVLVGQNKKARDWSVYYTYRRIEADALVGAFTDSDFGHNNRKGSAVIAKYSIFENLTLGAQLFFTDPVTGTAPGFRRLLLDLEFKF